MKSFTDKHAVAALVPALGAILAGPLASTPRPLPASASKLEEVVVTAQKREESLQDTPISLAVFNTRQLEIKGINTVADLRGNVPNLDMTPHPNSGSTMRIFIRGVGNNDDQLTQDPSVAVYLDGVYLARSQGLAMDVADIKRIEVLRGPQGTLYGRNATGGAINFITEEPQFDEWHAKQQITLGNRNLFRSKTTINIPAGETVAARLSYLHVTRDDFVKNKGTGVKDFGDRDRNAWRADLRWAPTDALDIRYSYDRSRIQDSPVFVARVPLFPATANRPNEGSPFVRNLRDNDIVTQGHSLTASWRPLDHLTLKSITAYRKLDSFQNQNYHTGVFGPFPVFSNASNQKQHQWSQEFQLLGNAADDRLKYVVGLYYFGEKGKNDSATVVTSRSISSGRHTEINNKAYAIYGQATWTPPLLDDRLHVTGGLRWSKDERHATLATDVTLLPSGTFIANPQTGNGDKSFDNVSPEVVLAYDMTDSINAYVKVAKGYKTGGFNVRASSIKKFDQGFKDENLTSYEFGIKSQWWNNRIRVNLAVFEERYDDIQINVQSDPMDPRITDVLNAGKATIDGAELDLTALLFDGLTVHFNYGYLDAGYDRITDATGADIHSRFRFIHSPTNSAAVDIQYDHPLPVGTLSADVGYSWQDDSFSASSIANGRYIIGRYGLLNVRLGWTDIPLPTGRLRIALWGKNLQDKEYYVAHFNTAVPSAIFGEPRSYGIDVIYQF